MRAVLYVLPVLGCGGMMVICMALMARGMRGHQGNQPADTTNAAPEVSAELEKLRAEVAELRAERETAHEAPAPDQRG